MGREGRDGSTRHIDDLTKINNEVGGGGGRRGLTAVVSDSVSLATNARVYTRMKHKKTSSLAHLTI